MAKAQPVTGLNAGASSRSSLPVMFAVRIGELWSWAEHLPYPHRIRELHDMRIAAKRLRYLFEFFAPCFEPEFKDNLKQFKRLQDYLGEIHDCDVWVVYLRRQLHDAFRELDRHRKALKQFAGADPELKQEAAALARELTHGPVQGLLMMLGDVVERRDRLYGELLQFWAELEQEGFRAELTRAVAQAASEEPAGQEG
ncbi:CHAD domain-containing protein [bacterium]|nr:CHAD domain-containing protein [bacterium]